jgi:hypothetical protein
MDKLIFTFAFASIVLAIVFISPSDTTVEASQNMYIYNFSDAFDLS